MDDLLSELMKQRAELAHTTMLRMYSTEFASGLAAGRYQGLTMAIELITTSIDNNMKEQI